MAVPVMPSTVQYGYVIGRFLLAVGDSSADPDNLPDPVVPSGKITLTPLAPVQLFPTSSPAVTILPQAIQLTLDSDGDIVDTSGNQGVWVITGQYEVSFSFVGVSYDSFTITVTTAHTQLAPLDLTVAAPIPQSPAVVFVVNQQVYNDTIAARDAAIAAANSIGTFAPLASPTLTGDPKAPTPATTDNDTSIATTAFVRAAITSYALTAASPALTGTPTAPTAAAGTSTTQIATTAFVAAGIASLVGGAPAQLDALNELAAALGNDANFAATTATALGLKAPIASPTFTGTASAPTPTAGDNTTKIATTAFVTTAIATKANLASPTFTGTPVAPTPITSDNSTTIATTAFVKSAVSAAGGYISPLTTLGDTLYGGASGVATRIAGNITTTKQFMTQTGTGTVSAAPTWGTIAVADVSGAAPLASPILTGTPQAPTATTGTQNAQIATTQFTATAQAMLVGVTNQSVSYQVDNFVLGRLIYFSAAAAATITIPTNATANFSSPVGTVINICNAGTFPLTIAPMSGVTLLSPSGLRITTQYGMASLTKVATDTWLVSGNTAI